MGESGKGILLEIMMLFRGIVRLICKAVIVLIVIIFLCDKALSIEEPVSTQIWLIVFFSSAVLIMWGYDQILKNCARRIRTCSFGSEKQTAAGSFIRIHLDPVSSCGSFGADFLLHHLAGQFTLFFPSGKVVQVSTLPLEKKQPCLQLSNDSPDAYSQEKGDAT